MRRVPVKASQAANLLGKRTTVTGWQLARRFGRTVLLMVSVLCCVRQCQLSIALATALAASVTLAVTPAAAYNQACSPPVLVNPCPVLGQLFDLLLLGCGCLTSNSGCLLCALNLHALEVTIVDTVLVVLGAADNLQSNKACTNWEPLSGTCLPALPGLSVVCLLLLLSV
jgi:hypothetical protein